LVMHQTTAQKKLVIIKWNSPSIYVTQFTLALLLV